MVPAVSAVGVQSREPTLRDGMVAEAFPTEIIEGWWCLCRILGNNTFYSEKWKIISRPVQPGKAARQRAMFGSIQS